MISNNFYQNETRTIVPSEQERFIKFQCRARQMIMRDNFGKPDESIIPKLYLKDQKILSAVLLHLFINYLNFLFYLN